MEAFLVPLAPGGRFRESPRLRIFEDISHFIDLEARAFELSGLNLFRDWVLCLRSQHRESFFLANQMISVFLTSTDYYALWIRLRTQLRSKQSQGKSLDTKLNKHTLELLVADDGDDPGRRAVIRVGHELVGLEL